MLVALFRSNRPAVLLLLAVLIPLVFLGAWGREPVTSGSHMPLYGPINALVRAVPGIAWWLGLLLVGLVSLQLTGLAQAAELLDQRTHLPALLFPLLLGAIDQGLPLDPALAGMPLVLLAMRLVLTLSQTGNTLGRLFDAGFMIGVAALFHLPYAFLVVVVLTAVSVIRPFHWREYVVPLLACALALFLCWSVVTLTGAMPWRPWASMRPDADMLDAVPRAQRLVLIITLGLLFVAAAVMHWSGFQRSVIRIKNMRAAFWGLMMALAVLIGLEHIVSGKFAPVLMAAPLSIFLGSALVRPNWGWLQDTLVAVLLLCALWVQW